MVLYTKGVFWWQTGIHGMGAENTAEAARIAMCTGLIRHMEKMRHKIFKQGLWPAHAAENGIEAMWISPGSITSIPVLSSDFFFWRMRDPWRNVPGRWCATSGSVFWWLPRRDYPTAAINLPPELGRGISQCTYLLCTVENQRQAQIRHCRFIKRVSHPAQKYYLFSLCLDQSNLSTLSGDWVEEVVAAGESGEEASCMPSWLRAELTPAMCGKSGASFHFMQTGALMVKWRKMLPHCKDNILLTVRQKAAGLILLLLGKVPFGRTEKFLIYKQNQNKKGTHLRSFFFAFQSGFSFSRYNKDGKIIS